MPAVLTLAMMGIELEKWPVYSEPAHLSVSTPEQPERLGRLWASLAITEPDT